MPNVNGRTKAVPYDHKCQPGSMRQPLPADNATSSHVCSVCVTPWNYDPSNKDPFQRWVPAAI